MGARVEVPAQMTGPNGETVLVSPKVFEALRSFTEQRKTGSVTIEFRDGGTAGVRVSYSLK